MIFLQNPLHVVDTTWNQKLSISIYFHRSTLKLRVYFEVGPHKWMSKVLHWKTCPTFGLYFYSFWYLIQFFVHLGAIVQSGPITGEVQSKDIIWYVLWIVLGCALIPYSCMIIGLERPDVSPTMGAEKYPLLWWGPLPGLFGETPPRFGVSRLNWLQKLPGDNIRCKYSQVTIFGESAGGWSVSHQLVTFLLIDSDQSINQSNIQRTGQTVWTSLTCYVTINVTFQKKSEKVF